jgi:hypothetical protein
MPATGHASAQRFDGRGDPATQMIGPGTSTTTGRRPRGGTTARRSRRTRFPAPSRGCRREGSPFGVVEALSSGVLGVLRVRHGLISSRLVAVGLDGRHLGRFGDLEGCPSSGSCGVVRHSCGLVCGICGGRCLRRRRFGRLSGSHCEPGDASRTLRGGRIALGRSQVCEQVCGLLRRCPRLVSHRSDRTKEHRLDVARSHGAPCVSVEIRALVVRPGAVRCAAGG